jgi:hypothetical protein
VGCRQAPFPTTIMEFLMMGARFEGDHAMRRRRPSSETLTPANDWLGRANMERAQRDDGVRQSFKQSQAAAAQRSAWRPLLDGVNRAQRVLRGTRDR